MNTITPDHKREFREAREQAIAAVERLNVLFAATGRTYRYELCLEKVQPPVIDDDDATTTTGGPASVASAPSVRTKAMPNRQTIARNPTDCAP